MGAVFVSYRRGDSEGQARALSIELVRLLGRNNVFMDVDGIALGRDFRQVLQEKLKSCDVMIALIGPGWLEAADSVGRRRIDSATDFVRQEIAAALKRNIPVIPVLVQGAQVPAPEQLPDDLKELSYRNGFELGHATWESDVQEMVKRLGLTPPDALEAAPPPSEGPPHRRSRSTHVSTTRIAAAVATLAAIAVVGVLYMKTAKGTPAVTTESTAITPPASDRSESPTGRTTDATGATPLPTGAPAGTSPLPPAAAAGDGGLKGSGLSFAWPGDDCWNIYRGETLVTYQCGTKQQALSAGRYIIKGRHAPVFAPFEVTVGTGMPTTISRGGVFEFAWPGDDCWNILRGAEIVTYQCGTKMQALGAGHYTIQGRHAPVFLPFAVDIADGYTTRVVKGGVFEFAWHGDDCWNILRGDEVVTYQCGAKKQALGAGRYTVQGRHAPVFDPFEIVVADAAIVKAP